MRQFTYIFLILSVVFSCKKKIIESNVLIPHGNGYFVNCWCPSSDLDVETQLADPSVYSVLDATNYMWPQINPNNPDEIAYLFQPYDNYQASKLIIYNMATQEKRVLVDEWVTGQISWGKKDWILFMKSEGLQLYKIKSNGDSLTPVGNGQWFHPSWNATGEKFVAFHKFNNYPYKTFILNVDGEVLDSIPDYWAHIDGDWSHPDYYLREDNNNIYLMDLEKNKVIKKISPPSNYADWGFFGEVGWIDHDKLYFSSMEDGQYIYNILTDEVIHVKCSCGSFFKGITHSSDFSRVIISRTEIQLIENDQKYFIDNKLFLTDATGLWEQEIVIP